jgi:hypothetical protein
MTLPSSLSSLGLVDLEAQGDNKTGEALATKKTFYIAISLVCPNDALI